MRTILLMAVLVELVSGAVLAQGPGSEEAAVRAALEHYLQGHATGDGSHHAKVFHEVADLYWMRDGELQTRTSEEYIAGAPGSPAADEARRRRRITMVDVTGDAAVARIELDYPNALITDYMSLLKIDGEWRIVNKIFHVGQRGASAAPSATTSDADNLMDTFATLNDRMERAVADNDPERVVALFAEGAVELPPNRRRRIGHKDIAERYADYLERVSDAEVTLTTDRVVVAESGELAYEIGSAYETGTGSDGVPHAVKAKYLNIWRLVGDEWRIAARMFSSDEPPD